MRSNLPYGACLAALLLCQADGAWAGLGSLTGKPAFAPGQILVRFKAGAPPGAKAGFLAKTLRAKALGGEGLYEVALAPGEDPLSASRKAAQDPSVEKAQPNYLYYAFACAGPTDAFFAPVTNWPFLAIQAPQAWALFPSCPPGSSSVTVAVLDTGCARTHPDLPPALLVPGYNALTGQADASLPNATDDDFGHGTFVTSLIAAQWNGGAPAVEPCATPPAFTSGMAGLAPGVRIMPVKVLDDKGNGSTESITAGIRFAIAHGAKIMNFSLGSSGFGDLEKEALDQALDAGCVLVAASGNEGGDLDYPAAYPPVLAVGALGPDGRPACYSNHGMGLDLVAPGGAANSSSCKGNSSFQPDLDIFGAVLSCPATASSEFNRMPGDGNFGTAAGTSASAPFVAGAAALVLSLYPGLPHDQVERRLIDNADNLNGGRGWDPGTGYGRLNVYRALANLDPERTSYVKTFNSPNPFYPELDGTTNITLVLTQPAPVDLLILDTAGETVLRKTFSAGELNGNPSNPQYKSFYIPWDGRNGNGQRVRTGVYFYSVRTGGQVGRNKIAVIEGGK